MATGKSNAPAKTGTERTEISGTEDISSFLEQVKRMPPAVARWLRDSALTQDALISNIEYVLTGA